MDIRTAFPSKYLRAADILGLPSKTIRLKMAQLKHETMKTKGGDEESKPVLFFMGAKKGMVLNKTNADRIAHHYGWDTDQWLGKPVDLYVAEVEAFGEQVDAIRVKVPPQPGGAPATAPLPVIQRQTEIMQAPDNDPFGDEPAPGTLDADEVPF